MFASNTERSRRLLIKFPRSAELWGQNRRPRTWRLTIVALGTLLMPGIGQRGGVLRFLVWAISAALRPMALLRPTGSNGFEIAASTASPRHVRKSTPKSLQFR
jgi:hypothetical protein